MTRDDELRVRPGRIRARGDTNTRSFVAKALAAAERAGGRAPRIASAKRASTFGRGRSASLTAGHRQSPRSRVCVVKARVVRHSSRTAPLGPHLKYLRRDGVTRDGARGQLFNAERDGVDAGEFADRCDGDRHHFRFIVSPEDGPKMADLKAFTRDLMGQAAKDLDTGLDWVAVEHWDTQHPHVHVLVRGRADDGHDLVVSRDYISEGLRARAQALVTQELGPRTDVEIRRTLDAQVNAERWTSLDKALVRDAAARDGVIDLRPDAVLRPDDAHRRRAGRLEKLGQLGLAEEVAPGRWAISPGARTTLRALGERGDIIKRLHHAMADRRASEFVLAGEAGPDPVIGRLVARGLDDELKGTAYAIVDGVDGRAHHLRLPHLDATGDGAPGSIVELRRFTDAGGRERVALAVRSDLALEAQVSAPGATWLDRRLLDRTPISTSEASFGGEVRAALEARTEHLVGEGLARRQGQRMLFARDLLDSLQRRELDGAAARLAETGGLPHRPVADGDHVSGLYRQRLTLASGRFAMIDDGLGFSMVPWTPALEKHLGQQVTGVATAGGVDWSLGRKRGLGIG